ncbi:MAG: minor capsid protein [Muribaculaceae bacterium]|nr:minor capsid protein [Muribaculaceae bacterium]
MALSSRDYWAIRARQDKIKVIKTGEQGIDNLKRILKKNLEDVDKKIKEFYEKYGDNPAEKLSYAEFEKYKEKLARKARLHPKDKTLQKLAKQNIPKYKIDRLRALQIDLQIMLTEATAGQEAGIYKTLQDVGKVSQATLAARFAKSLGVEFNTIAARKMKQLMTADWCQGKNWSERIWADRDKVGEKLTNILEKGIPQGTSLQKMSRELRDVTGNSFNNAFRLIRTESAHVDAMVTLEGYKQTQQEFGQKLRYRFDAFLDNRTSKICRELNGKTFWVDDAEIGVNFFPMHPNCRSTTQLIIPENDWENFDFFN